MASLRFTQGCAWAWSTAHDPPCWHGQDQSGESGEAGAVSATPSHPMVGGAFHVQEVRKVRAMKWWTLATGWRGIPAAAAPAAPGVGKTLRTSRFWNPSDLDDTGLQAWHGSKCHEVERLGHSILLAGQEVTVSVEDRHHGGVACPAGNLLR